MYRIIKQNKYHSQSREYNGHLYQSGKEADYAHDLDLRVKAKDIRGWSRQERIPLDFNGYHVCNYIIDFVILHNDGVMEYVEVKGFETEVWRLKWKMFEALYGKKENVILTVVK